MKVIKFNLVKRTFTIGGEMTASEQRAFEAGLAGKPITNFEMFDDAWATGRAIFLLDTVK